MRALIRYSPDQNTGIYLDELLQIDSICGSEFDKHLDSISMGWCHLSRGVFPEAITSFLLAQEYFKQIFPWKNIFLAEAYIGIGISNYQQGKYSAAIMHFENAVSIYKRAYGPYHKKKHHSSEIPHPGFDYGG